MLRPSSKGLTPAGLPPNGCGLFGNCLSLLGRHTCGPRLPAHTAKRHGGGVLAVIGDLVLDLAGRDPHDVDGVADHVAGAALAFGASWHYLWPRFKPVLNDLLSSLSRRLSSITCASISESWGR